VSSFDQVTPSGSNKQVRTSPTDGTIDTTSVKALLLPCNIEVVTDVLKETMKSNFQGQELVDISSTAAAQPLSSTADISFELAEPQDVLSEDEVDVQTLKRNSLPKVMSWNDGSRKLVTKHAAVRRLREEEHVGGVTHKNGHDDEENNPEPPAKTTPGRKAMPSTIEPFKNDPLKGMVPIESTKVSCDMPASSFLTFSRERESRKDTARSKPCNQSYAEAVTRTQNKEAGTVTVGSL